MILEMRKFGNVLNSRPAGREAVLRAKQIINGSAGPDVVILDFSGVELLTPSFADEFINGLKQLYEKNEIKLEGYKENKVIQETLAALNFIPSAN